MKIPPWSSEALLKPRVLVIKTEIIINTKNNNETNPDTRKTHANGVSIPTARVPPETEGLRDKN